MSTQITFLHSHSGLERTIRKNEDKDIANKSHVLVDVEYENVFSDTALVLPRVTFNGVTYIKVPTLLFVKKGGAFKNYNE